MWLFVVGALLWSLSFLLAFGYLLNPRAHDWDLDSFLFLGDQLWKGNLLFVTEFETKLPLLQQAFAMIVPFGGIGAWRIFTLAVVTICQVLTGIYLSRLLKIRSKLAWFSISGLGTLTTYSLPEASSSHIGMVASSLQLLAFVVGPLLMRNKGPIWQLLPGAIWAMACNLRPNLVFVYLFVLLASVIISPGAQPRAVLRLLLSSLGGFGLLTLLTFSPYFVNVETAVSLIEGLEALASFSSGSSATLLLLRFFVNRFTLVFFGSLGLGIVITILVLLRSKSLLTKNVRLGVAFAALAGVFGLFVSFMSSHYMPHHSVMFAPFALLFSVLLFQRLTLPDSNLSKLSKYASLVVVAGLVTTGPIALNILIKEWEGVNWKINDRQIDSELLHRLTQAKESKQSFYVVDGSQYHFILSERRQGDGHPAMMLAFLKGKDIPILATKISEEVSTLRCEALWSRDPHLIVIVNPNTELGILTNECIEARGDLYSPTASAGVSNALIFESTRSR